MEAFKHKKKYMFLFFFYNKHHGGNVESGLEEAKNGSKLRWKPAPMTSHVNEDLVGLPALIYLITIILDMLDYSEF